jgi:CspA family cold shock protein
MVYRDTWAKCEECGNEYVFTVEEQRRLEKAGQEVVPSVCPKCQKTAEIAPGPGEGVVKWYDAEKGYGFITQPSGAEVFFHRTSIVQGDSSRFVDGVRVSFTIQQSDRGPQAVEVALLEEV